MIFSCFSTPVFSLYWCVYFSFETCGILTEKPHIVKIFQMHPTVFFPVFFSSHHVVFSRCRRLHGIFDGSIWETIHFLPHFYRRIFLFTYRPSNYRKARRVNKFIITKNPKKNYVAS